MSDGYSAIPQHESTSSDESGTRPTKKKPVALFVILGIVVLLLIGGGVFCFFHFRHHHKKSEHGVFFDRYDALIVEDSDGLISIYNAQAMHDQCFINFTDEDYSFQYKDGDNIDVLERIFKRKIGHKILADMDCTYDITPDFNISYKDGECPDMKNVTPPGIDPPKLTNCTKYEYIEDYGYGFMIITHFWVTGRRLVTLRQYAEHNGRLLQDYHQYFIKFEEKDIPKSVFVRPKDVTIYDLSKPYFPPDEEIPKTETKPILQKAFGGNIPGRLDNRPPMEQIFSQEFGHKPQRKLINLLRPHSGRVTYQIVNGRLVRYVKPEPEYLSEKSSPEAKSQIRDRDIPASYDVREVYGSKCPTTLTIYDQGQCGCCWAMAAANSFSDRMCIATDGKIKASYSTQYLINCVNDSIGCNGGAQDTAWEAMVSIGIVTEDCVPFIEDDDECHVDECTDPSVKPETKYLHTAYSPFSNESWAVNEKAIQQDILDYGSVETCFWVMPDFMLYSRGVYRHKGTSEYQGGHCVRMMGWGVDPRAGAYWIIANSWGDDWGEDGYFRVARGINDCGFEDSIASGQVKV